MRRDMYLGGAWHIPYMSSHMSFWGKIACATGDVPGGDMYGICHAPPHMSEIRFSPPHISICSPPEGDVRREMYGICHLA